MKRREGNVFFISTLTEGGANLPVAAALMGSEMSPRCVEHIFQHSDTDLKPKEACFVLLPSGKHQTISLLFKYLVKFLKPPPPGVFRGQTNVRYASLTPPDTSQRYCGCLLSYSSSCSRPQMPRLSPIG